MRSSLDAVRRPGRGSSSSGQRAAGEREALATDLCSRGEAACLIKIGICDEASGRRKLFSELVADRAVEHRPALPRHSNATTRSGP